MRGHHTSGPRLSTTMVRVRFALLLALVLLGISTFASPGAVLPYDGMKKPERATLKVRERTRKSDNYKDSIVSFIPVPWSTADGYIRDEGHLLYGSLNFVGDQDWFIVATSKGDRSRIRDLGEMDWSDEFQVPDLPLLPPPRDMNTARVLIPSRTSGKKIDDEDVNPHIAKPIVGHMYLVHTYRERPRREDWFSLEFNTLVRVEELQPSESCTITWKRISKIKWERLPPKKK